MDSHVLGRRYLRHCRQYLVPRPHHVQQGCAHCDLADFEPGAHHRDTAESGGSVCECLGHALGDVGVDDVRYGMVPRCDRVTVESNLPAAGPAAAAARLSRSSRHFPAT